MLTDSRVCVRATGCGCLGWVGAVVPFSKGLVAASNALCMTQGSRNMMFVPRRMRGPWYMYTFSWYGILQTQVDSNTALAGTTGPTVTTRTAVQACCRESLKKAAMATVLRLRSKGA